MLAPFWGLGSTSKILHVIQSFKLWPEEPRLALGGKQIRDLLSILTIDDETWKSFTFLILVQRKFVSAFLYMKD